MDAISIAESYRLGSHLTSALDHILRTATAEDPRPSLNQAIFWLNRASAHGKDLVHGLPLDTRRPAASVVATNCRLSQPLAMAVGAILQPLPSATDALRSANWVRVAIEEFEEARSLSRARVILDEEVAA